MERPFPHSGCKEAYVLWSLGRNGLPDILPLGGCHDSPDVDFIYSEEGIWQIPAGPSCDIVGEGADPFLRVEAVCDPVWSLQN